MFFRNGCNCCTFKSIIPGAGGGILFQQNVGVHLLIIYRAVILILSNRFYKEGKEMAYIDSTSWNWRKRLFVVGGRAWGVWLSSLVLAGCLYAQEELTDLIHDIKNGPATYYSAEAYSFLTRNGEAVSSQVSRDVALRTFQALIKIATMGPAARDAASTLVELFPRAVHVTEVRNVRYSGEGTFDDWVQTYVASEKTKFLLSSPFLDYNAMRQCEQFIVSTFALATVSGEKVVGTTRSPLTITVTHTANLGACALAHITGEVLDADHQHWMQWWEQNRSTFTAASSGLSPREASGMLRGGQSFRTIIVGGKYKMNLSTGDEFIGYVESKDDTSLVIEAQDGRPYTFSKNLLVRYDLLEQPSPRKSSVRKDHVADTLPLTFDDLVQRQSVSALLEVRLNSGSVFRGTLLGIDSLMLRLDVGGSTIPISREVVLNIKMIPKRDRAEPARKPAQLLQTDEDTVYVQNTETDDWGKPKPNFVLTGKIEKEGADNLILAAGDGTSKTIPWLRVLRIVKNSSGNYEEQIKKYAKRLFCPEDMFLVDMPPGKQGRPFFKVCIDRYEFPNKAGAVPKGNVTYDAAQKLCAQQGKRLCRAFEWQWGCSGIEGYTYPYGWNIQGKTCNSGDNALLVPSGERRTCVSKFGGYDMVGNIFEWVTGPDKQPALVGGPYAKCQTRTDEIGGGAKPQTGFRCCKD